MIFVTVGAQLAFDRMIQAVDAWAKMKHRTDIFAQIGATTYQPRYLSWVDFLPPSQFIRCVKDAKALVAHAGMGSILTALELGKPLLVMPRRGDLHETRNDHQVATARYFLQHGYVHVAFGPQELNAKMDQLDSLNPGPIISSQASADLIAAVRLFVNQPVPLRWGWLKGLMGQDQTKPSMERANRI